MDSTVKMVSVEQTTNEPMRYDNYFEDTDDNISDLLNNGTGRSPPYWDLPTRITMSSCLCVIFVAAVVGNSMVLSIIIRHRGMRTRTNLFLASLAVADLLVAVLDMPFSLTTMIVGDWIFGKYFCVFNGFTMSLFLITSIHTLMYISIHKYITITRPFSRVLTFRRILIMIAAAWIWAAFCATTTVTGLTSVEYKPSATQCGPVYPSTLLSYIQSGIVTIGCYAIPLVIMTVSYICMVREIIGYSSRLKEHSNQEIDVIMQQQKRIILTLFIVVALFFCCWTPYIVYSMYAASIAQKDKIPAILNGAVYWCGYLNSACNPIVYALRSPSFREGYREIFCQGPAYITDDMLGPFGMVSDGEGRPITLLQFYTLRDESPNPLRRFSTLLRSSFRGSFSTRSKQSVSTLVANHRRSTNNGSPVRVSRASMVRFMQQNGAHHQRKCNGRVFTRTRSEPYIMVRANGKYPAYYPIEIKEVDEVGDGKQQRVTNCDWTSRNNFHQIPHEDIGKSNGVVGNGTRALLSRKDAVSELNANGKYIKTYDRHGYCHQGNEEYEMTPFLNKHIENIDETSRYYTQEGAQLGSPVCKSEDKISDDDKCDMDLVFLSDNHKRHSLGKGWSSEPTLNSHRLSRDSSTSNELVYDCTILKNQAKRTKSGPYKT